MKKFTSLFALLAGLCVFSAQADPFTIYFFSSNPASQVCYWFWYENDVKHESNWNTSISSNSDIVSLGNNFFKKEFANDYNSTLKIIFHDEYQGNETQQIALQEGDNYFYYFGNKYYLTSDALKIAGPFTEWQTNPQNLTINSLSTWTYDLEPNENEDAVPFKIIAKRIKDDWSGVEDKWLGYNESNLLANNNNPFISVVAPEGWITNSEGNFLLNHASTGYQKYKLTATWNSNNNSNFAWGWTLKIEGVGSLNLDLDDNTPFLGDGVATSATSATYSRECANQWGTLCLPFGFNVSEQQLATQNVTFYSFSAVNPAERTIKFSPISNGQVSPGQAVLFKLLNSPEGRLSIRANNGVSVTSAPQSGESVGLYGTFVEARKDNVYYISADQFYFGSNILIKPYRGFVANAQGPSEQSGVGGAPFRFTVDDTEDIQFVEQEDGTVKAYYDLQGRKLDGARKGLVIENGKIIMVK